MKECKTRIKVTNEYKEGKLVATTYLPEYRARFLFWQRWDIIDRCEVLEYVKLKGLPNEYKTVFECREWVESFVTWWREKNFVKETFEINYYDCPED